MGRRELRDIAVKCLFQYDFICRKNEIKELVFCQKIGSAESVFAENISLQGKKRKIGPAERCHAILLGKDSEFSDWDNYLIQSKAVDFCCGNLSLKEKKVSRLFSLSDACVDSFGRKYFSRGKNPTALISYKKSSNNSRSVRNNGDCICVFEGGFKDLQNVDGVTVQTDRRRYISSDYVGEHAVYSYGVPFSIDKVKPRASAGEKEQTWYSSVSLELFWDKLSAGDYTVLIVGGEKDSLVPGSREILSDAVEFTLLDSFDELERDSREGKKDIILFGVSVDCSGYTFISENEKLRVLCKNADLRTNDSLCVFTCSGSKALSNYFYGEAKCPEDSFETNSMIDRLCDMCVSSNDDEKDCENADWTLDDEFESYFKSVIKGTIENIEEIDSRIKENTIGWAFERISRIDLAVLRVAVYEILYREDVPSAVAINEAIEIAKKYSSEKSSIFINGVLGGVCAANGKDSEG